MERLISKVNIFGLSISVTDYEQASDTIISLAKSNRSFAVSALAVHGLMEAVSDPELAQLINKIDLVTPDGQPVLWAMNLLAETRLNSSVCGPDLTKFVCSKAAKEGIGIYLFGSTHETVNRLSQVLRRRYPEIKIIGVQPDRFRDATPNEDEEDIKRINASGAGIVLVGLGCPKQERWVAEHRGKINACMIAVGAAFDYIAGNLSRSPDWMKRYGLEWFYRLIQEPRRLLKRYMVTNSKFLYMLSRDWLNLKILKVIQQR